MVRAPIATLLGCVAGCCGHVTLDLRKRASVSLRIPRFPDPILLSKASFSPNERICIMQLSVYLAKLTPYHFLYAIEVVDLVPFSLHRNSGQLSSVAA